MADGAFARNIGTIGEKGQKKLGSARVGVVGLGGTGGIAFETLVRAGAGNFVIADGDRFERANFNRQIYATRGNLGKWKVDAAAEKAVSINPKIRIEKYRGKLHGKNIGKLEKCDIVIDGTDNLETRRIIAGFCRKNGIPYVFCSAGGARGMVSVFAGGDFGGIFGKAEETKKKRSVIAPAAILAGTLAASQAINAVLKKRFVKAPEFLFFDLFSEKVLWKHKV